MEINDINEETLARADHRENRSTFSVRIVVCDYYLTKPVPGIDVIYSEFRGSDIKQVPVLRVFGPTPDGRKACLHIHGVFPYFYLPCPNSNPEPQFLYQIASSLDKALNIAMKQASSSNQHVYKISLVKGLPFYGFHDKEHLYLKVFLYNPGLIKQAVELCSNGAILGQSLQPHESHLNFTLQFFIDFNLFGMSNIDLQTVIFRKSGISQESDDPLKSPNELNLKAESICYYEGDCIASHIVNRQRIGKGDGIENPGLEEVWNQELERRKQLNVSLASKSLSQGRIKSEETDSHYKYENMFQTKMSQVVKKPIKVDKNILNPLEKIHYPAETAGDSQIFNATDISTHISETMLNLSNNTTLKNSQINNKNYDEKNITVDEDIALNSSFSLQYSQILLDSEDLELVEVLQDLDEKPVEEDSIMGTQVNDSEEELDDAEYSKVFDEDTVLLDPHMGADVDIENTISWEDSFWDGANIPQLDGTFDDEHVKKVRKRKMRPFKLGLSRPKSKKNFPLNSTNKNVGLDAETDEAEVINVSRETIEGISISHLRRSQVTSLSILDSVNINLDNEEVDCDMSISRLVTQMSTSEKGKLEHRMLNEDEAMPGPSHVNVNPARNSLPYASSDDSYLSTPEDNEKFGIKSFYNTSKYFDLSIEEPNQNVKNAILDGNVDESVNNPKNEITTNETDIQTGSDIHLHFSVTHNNLSMGKVLTPKVRPPSKKYILDTLEKYNIPKIKNPEPYFSNYKDVGDKVEIGHMTLKVNSKFSRDQKLFDKLLNVTSIEEWRHLLFLQSNDIDNDSPKSDLKLLLASNRQCILKPVKQAPTSSEVHKWLQDKRDLEGCNDNKSEIHKIEDEMDTSQVIGLNDSEINNSVSLVTSEKEKCLDNTLQITMQPDGSFLCFVESKNPKESSLLTPVVETDFLTLMFLEVHTSVRGDLHPDPAFDPIQALFFSVTNDCPTGHFLLKSLTEIFVVNSEDGLNFLDRCVFEHQITYFNNEQEIFEKLIEIVQKHDPDIMCGYEIEMTSWGYVLERAQALGIEIVKELSRITDKNRQKRWRNDDNDLEGRVLGRLTFNVWRLFRYELALSSYSFENCMYVVLKERVPTYTYAQLSEWWDNSSRMLRWIPIEYYKTRLSGTVRMLEKLDIINRTSELARLFGLQWWEVLSRGSQFRVESLMLRAARPLNLVALSPTVKQRAAMKAPECLPLIFEPESRFYTDPVIVLDFQSLYPSMMIAYNYCFSTCIGRVQNINGDTPYEFGAWKLRISKAKLEALSKQGLIHWSPVGVGFVKSSVRRGVLPALLRRILAARQAVKKGMKMQTDDSVKKAMHSRQLGLKLIANVTYGYTAANFSGRMPCVEVGDSVVAKGRETLERAIRLVTGGPWNVKVVYGDTDSMFVAVPGASRATAFAIGQQIADAVTADNPSPVALKLEKVYQPCILQTKKRYVGYMYESADQEKPIYEAKGIETVRRDGCPAGVKLLQSALCTLFSTGDASQVKRQVCAALHRLEGAAPPELLFTREYHGPAGYRPAAAAPPREIAKRLVSRDPRAAPRTGWRVSWVVCAGAPGAALVRLARTPRELLLQPALAPHLAYYTARVLLPPLHRCLSLLGLDVFKWWKEIGCNREAQLERVTGGGGGIARYLQRGRCAVCGARGCRALCSNCATRTRDSAAALSARGARVHADLYQCDQICASCCGHQQYSKCENTECPVLWRRVSTQQKLEQLRDVITNLPSDYNLECLDF